MFSLIITIVAIALVAALALATLFYGGSAYDQASGQARASTIVNQGQQLLGASELYYAKLGVWPASVDKLVEDGFLKDIPVVQNAVNPAFAAKTWTMPMPGQPVFILETETVGACRSVNEKVYGMDGILPRIQAGVVMQCYGTSAALTTMYSVAGRNAETIQVVAASGLAPFSEDDVTVDPIPAATDAGAWLLRPGQAPSTGTDAGSGDNEEPPGATALVLNPGQLNFGKIDAASGELTLGLTNPGTSPYALDTPVISDGADSFALVANACGTSIAPGATCSLTVRFTPTVLGTLSGTLTLPAASEGPVQQVSLSGQKASRLGNLQGISAYGTLALNTNLTRTFTFTNTGTEPLTGLSAALDTGVSGLTITGGNCGTAGSPVTVQPGDSCTVDVRWAPTEGSSLSGSSLRINGTYDNAPAKIDFTGMAGSFDATSAFSPSSIDVGPYEVGSVTATDLNFGFPTSFRVTNNGTSGALRLRFVMTGDVDHFRLKSIVKLGRSQLPSSANACLAGTGVVSPTEATCLADDAAAGSGAQKDIIPVIEFKPQAVGNFSVTLTAYSLNGAAVPATPMVITGRGEWNPSLSYVNTFRSGVRVPVASTTTIAPVGLGQSAISSFILANAGTNGVPAANFTLEGDTSQFSIQTIYKADDSDFGNVSATGCFVNPDRQGGYCVADSPRVTNAKDNIQVRVQYLPTTVGSHTLRVKVTPRETHPGRPLTVVPGDFTFNASAEFNAAGVWRQGPQSASAAASSATIALTGVGLATDVGATTYPQMLFMHNTGNRGALNAGFQLTGDTQHFRIQGVFKFTPSASPSFAACGTRVSDSQWSACTADVPGVGTATNIAVRIVYAPLSEGNHSVSVVPSTTNESTLPSALPVQGSAHPLFNQAASGTSLSNGGVTANWNSTNPGRNITVGPLKTSGKYYLEFYSPSTRTGMKLGLLGNDAQGAVRFLELDLQASALRSNMQGSTMATGAGLTTTTTITDGTSSTTLSGAQLGTYASSEYYSVEFDIDSQTVTFYRNGTAVARFSDITLSPTGLQPYAQMTNTRTGSVSLRNGQPGATFSRALPSGFTAGWR